MSCEDEIKGTVTVSEKEDHHYTDRSGINRSTKTEENELVLQNPNTKIINYEVEEAEPILQQQRNSTWVQDNLIKLEKIFEIDFHEHKEEGT